KSSTTASLLASDCSTAQSTLLKNTGSMLYGASCCAYDDQRITSRTFFKPASPIFLKYSGFMGGSGTVSPLRSNTPGMLMPRPSLRFCSKGSVPGAAFVCNGNRAIKVSTMGKRLIQILGKRLCGRCQPGYLCSSARRDRCRARPLCATATGPSRSVRWASVSYKYLVSGCAAVVNRDIYAVLLEGIGAGRGLCVQRQQGHQGQYDGQASHTNTW